MVMYSGLSTLSIIDSMSSQFTKTDWKIVQFIKNSPQDFLNNTAIETANVLNTSDASVIRFAQKIGFKGLNEFKIQFKIDLKDAQSLKGKDNSMYKSYSDTIDVLFTILDETHLHNFVNEVNKADEIYICSFNQHSFLANQFSDRLLLLGLHIRPVSNAEAFEILASRTTKNDLYIFLDLNNDFDDYLKTFSYIKQNNAAVLTISDALNSNHEKLSTYTINIPNKSDLYSDFSISKNTIMLIVFDILFHALLNSDFVHNSMTLAKSVDATKSNELNSSNDLISKLNLKLGD